MNKCYVLEAAPALATLHSGYSVQVVSLENLPASQGPSRTQRCCPSEVAPSAPGGGRGKPRYPELPHGTGPAPTALQLGAPTCPLGALPVIGA